MFIPVLFMGGIVGRLLARVRGHDYGGDSDLGLRFDQPDAHAVQPLLASASRSASWPPLLVVRAGLRLLARALQPDAAREPQYRSVTAAVSVVLMVATVYLFIQVPKGFLPSEDQGRFNVNTEGAQGISFDEMVRHQLQVADVLLKDPNIASAGVNVGQMGNNATGG